MLLIYYAFTRIRIDSDTLIFTDKQSSFLVNAKVINQESQTLKQKLPIINTISICVITFMISLNTQAQIQFEQVAPPPPAPQVIAEFSAFEDGSIAFADIDGDGDQDVLLTGSTTGSFGNSELYTNDGNGNYSLLANTPFAGVYHSSIAFADIDGDGDQDVLITGLDNDNEGISELYTNDGSGNFSLMANTPFTGVAYSAIAFADIDGDGDQDVLITGTGSDNYGVSELYTNDGFGVFSLLPNTPFLSVDWSAIAFADIDGDMDQDILITGRDNSNNGSSKLYTNDGEGNYSLVANTPFTDIYRGSIAFADIDGDSDQDVLITGADNTNDFIAELYINDGNGIFSVVTNTPFIGVGVGSVAFADIDGDMDQDVLITGYSDPYSIAKLYTNDGNGNFSFLANTPFTGVYSSSVAFADVDGDNDQDVLISGETSSYDDISKLYINDGTGNFTFVTNTPFTNVYKGSVAFADIDGDMDQDVLITGYTNEDDPNTSLYRNDGTGNYSLVDNTPFKDVYQSSIAFADIDGDGDQDVLITGASSNYGRISELYTNDGLGNFSLVPNTPFIPISSGSIAFADIDGDMDQDVLISGSSSSGYISKLYSNDGNGNYSVVEFTPFESVANCSIAFADIDGDMDQDVLITGSGNSKLYTNDGTGDYSIVYPTPFTKLNYSSIAFADIDGDMDQDVLLTGFSDSFDRISELYTNDGTGDFYLVDNAPFPGVYNGSIAFADIDGDTDQDVLITGSSESGSFTELYLNDGNGNYSPVENLPFQNVGYSSVAIADIDGDNLKDVLITGISPNGPISRLYRNITINPCQINASCQPFTLALDETGNGILQPSDIDNGSTVVCGVANLSLSKYNFNCSDVGANMTTLTVTDDNGNFETCIAEVTVTPDSSCQDCAGVVNGTATIDACGVCSGGNTGLDPNTSCTDCQGVVNGDAQPGTLCNDGNNFGIYDTECNCEILPVVHIDGHVTQLVACGLRSITISIYNQEFPELNNVFSTTIDSNGDFTTPELSAGTYSILVKVDGYLTKLFPNQVIESDSNPLVISGLIGGDFNNTNSITITDITVMSMAFGSEAGDVNFNSVVDLNCDGIVNILDVTGFSPSFGLAGDHAPGE